jgi:hypothetical protein
MGIDHDITPKSSNTTSCPSFGILDTAETLVFMIRLLEDVGLAR